MREREPISEQILAGEYKLRSLKEAEQFLYDALPSAPKVLFKEGEGFNRSRYFLRELGDPQDEYKTVHIAGTSGKGSTTYYISGLLKAHGFLVGTHVSPHVYDVRERGLIGLEPLDEKPYIDSINETIPVIRKMDELDMGRPTYFEVTLGAAFSMFAHQRVDYAVIETGLGGRYDTTNAINRSDKLAVITKLGLDHTEVLGDTIEKITYQKAGILKDNGQAIALKQPDDGANNVIKKVAAEKRSDLALVDSQKYFENVQITPQGVSFDYSDEVIKIQDCVIPNLGTYQLENVAVAIKALETLSKRDGFRVQASKVKEALASTRLPGRNEIVVKDDKTILLDGAHNPQKMQTLVSMIKELDLPRKPLWVVGFKKGKDVDAMVEMIGPVAESVYCTEFFRNMSNEQLRDFALDAEEVTGKFKKLGVKASAVSDPKQAFDEVLHQASREQLVVISGSLYLLGEVRKAITRGY